MPPRWFRADLLAESLPQSPNAASDAAEEHEVSHHGSGHRGDHDDDDWRRGGRGGGAAKDDRPPASDGAAENDHRPSNPGEDEEEPSLPVDTGLDFRGRRRLVRFRAQTFVQHTLRCDDYSAEEQEACWLTDADLKRMQNDTMVEVMSLKMSQNAGAGADGALAGMPAGVRLRPGAGSGDGGGSGGGCLRGIEHLLNPRELRAREAAKAKCVKSVLQRQEELLAAHQQRRHERLASRGGGPAFRDAEGSTFAETHVSFDEADEMSVEIARASERRSAKSRELALMLAQADAEWAARRREKDASRARRAARHAVAASASASASQSRRGKREKPPSQVSPKQERQSSKSGKRRDMPSSEILSRVRGILEDCHLNA